MTTPLSPAPLILVTGAPASGKTTLARALGEATGWPVLHRDVLKEIMLDEWGASDRAASRRIGRTSWLLFDAMLGTLASRVPLIAEANLSGPGIERVWPLLDQPGARVLHCHADRDTLHRRIQARTNSPDRHPGHFDVDAWPELAGALDRGDYEQVAWPCPTLLVDSASAAGVDTASILAWLSDRAKPTVPDPFAH